MEPTTCDQLRSALLEGDALRGSEWSAHLASCVECAHVHRAWPLAARALREAERHAAPPELASAVVAAMHAGVRGDRAVRALQRLARIWPPQELDDALMGGSEDVGPARRDPAPPNDSAALSGSGQDSGDDAGLHPGPAGDEHAEDLARVERTPAPRVLDRLVHEELLDPAKALARRHVGGLARLQAPDELARRVAEELLRPASATGAVKVLAPAVSASVRQLASRRVRRVLAAAALFVALAVPLVFLSREPEVRTRPFRVEHAQSLGALSPISRSLLDSASSGLISLDRS